MRDNSYIARLKKEYARVNAQVFDAIVEGHAEKRRMRLRRKRTMLADAIAREEAKPEKPMFPWVKGKRSGLWRIEY